MKKLFLTTLLLLINSLSAFSADEIVQTYGENNKFGLIKNNEKITKAEFKKLIRLGESSWLFLKGSKYGIISNTGEVLTYNHKKTFSYDFSQIKEVLEEIGALPKAVKLNNAFVDRLVAGNAVNEEIREKIKSARVEISENKSFSIVKPDKNKN